MKTRIPHQKKTAAHAIEFAGLQDWFEIFRAGEQTDSKGNTQTFSEADLDSIVSNHNADDPAPLVVGHPKTNDPAFGWTAALQRVGDTLFAKATDVVQAFDDAVRAKNYRKRSISILPDGKGGFKLRHIGFLGAAAPAVEGLADIAYSADAEAMEFSYSMADEKRAIGWSLDTMGRSLRRVREYLIDQQGMEVADKLIPSWDVESIESQSARLIEQANAAGNTYSSHHANTGAKPMTGKQEPEKTFTQADMDAALQAERAKAEALQQQLRDNEFAAADAKTQVVLDALIAKGVKPAALVGVREFCSHLARLDAGVATFEFSAAEGGKKESKTLHAQVLDFMNSLMSGDGVIALGKNTSAEPEGDGTSDYKAPDGATVDPARAALDKKVREYSKKHGVDYITALNAVEA